MSASPPSPVASVIIPAHDEAAFIGQCLEALLASECDAPFEVIVVANGCKDDTAARARKAAESASRPLNVIETAQGGKPNALQLGDTAARGTTRIYLDADVLVSPGLIAALIAALEDEAPRYAGGTPVISTARSALTRAYARFWQRLPFFRTGVPGFGIYAVNHAGRARWSTWPDIISDDTFARLQFAPEERVRVEPTYTWPMVEGIGRLIRVRRRQDRGVAQVMDVFPELGVNADRIPDARARKARAALRDPLGFVVYATVALCVRAFGNGARPGAWERGR
ncbi:MAG: glycosyltransferase [Roseovarius sp.]